MSEPESSSTDLLSAVLIPYGSISLVLFTLFSLIRNRYELLYHPRDASGKKELHCELATQRWGIFGWIPGVLSVEEDDFVEQCGLDAACFVRVLVMGLKLALIGCFNAIWLLAAYRTAPTKTENADVTDGLDQLSLANVTNNDPRMIGTVISAYIISFAGMYLLFKDFEWFIMERHKFMSKKIPQNYTVAVDNIPPELRSKACLSPYLKSILGDHVFEINFVLHISELEKDVAEREKLIPKLEHSVAQAKAACEGPDDVNVWAPTGFDRGNKDRPTHKDKTGYQVDSIEAYSNDVQTLTDKVNTEIDSLEKEFVTREAKIKKLLTKVDADSSLMDFTNWDQIDTEKVTQDERLVSDSALISFKTLWAATIAAQVLHHQSPFTVQACSAPHPKCVFWKNLGLDFKRVQVTTLLAGALTAVTCLLWTFPITFVASLTKVESLKARIPALETAGEKFTLLDDFLGFLSPVGLVVLTNLLPMILKFFCELEGHIGTDSLNASLFSKLTIFMIIQIFFISAISGSLFDEIDDFIKDPAGKLINILATSLPGQGVIFMNFVVVKYFLGSMIELLRIIPAVISFIHKSFAPNLTEKQIRAPWMGLNPLYVPGELNHAAVLSHVVLQVLILFVYSSLLPVSSFVVALGFLLQILVYRNQFIFVYNPNLDSGGLMWPKFAGYAVLCMLIAQVTILGVVALKEGVAAPFMFPLIILTLLFWNFMTKQHFKVAATLPLPECIRVDRQREGLDMGFLRRAYRQKALLKVNQDDIDMDPVMVQATAKNAAELTDLINTRRAANSSSSEDGLPAAAALPKLSPRDAPGQGTNQGSQLVYTSPGPGQSPWAGSPHMPFPSSPEPQQPIPQYPYMQPWAGGIGGPTPMGREGRRRRGSAGEKCPGAKGPLPPTLPPFSLRPHLPPP